MHLPRTDSAAGEFPADQIHASKKLASFSRAWTPNTLRTLRAALGNNQAGLNRLSQANLVVLDERRMPDPARGAPGNC